MVEGGVLSLNLENLDNVIGDRSVFIMFYTGDDANSLQATWEKLAKEWEGHDHGVILQVDCGDETASILKFQ